MLCLLSFSLIWPPSISPFLSLWVACRQSCFVPTVRRMIDCVNCCHCITSQLPIDHNLPLTAFNYRALCRQLTLCVWPSADVCSLKCSLCVNIYSMAISVSLNCACMFLCVCGYVCIYSDKSLCSVHGEEEQSLCIWLLSNIFLLRDNSRAIVKLSPTLPAFSSLSHLSLALHASIPPSYRPSLPLFPPLSLTE